MKIFISLFLLMASLIHPKELRTGADRLLSEYLHLLKGKNIGLVTNHTGLLANGTHLADTLITFKKDFQLTALFGPEHGIRGDAAAGEEINSKVDKRTGLTVFSLYGKERKPTKEMLTGIDLLIFDIQDVGARFYTYISTLHYVLQAGAENKIPVIVLDRPNPINGIYVDGPIRKEKHASFVGIAPIPIAHGMTIGELAEMFSGEGWLKVKKKPDLTVIKMDGWERNSFFDEYNIEWLKPSPNIPYPETAIVYPGTCLIEGLNVSEGRGTNNPFLLIGAPFINPPELIERLKEYGSASVKLEETEFTPVVIPGMAYSPKYENEKCKGIRISIRNRNKFESVKFGIELVKAIYDLYPGKAKFISSFDRLSGDEQIRESIIKGKSPEKIFASWSKELNEFLQVRKKYLLYN
jgi:uncharacterized protein YbbC (DUF1343 family)